MNKVILFLLSISVLSVSNINASSTLEVALKEEFPTYKKFKSNVRTSLKPIKDDQLKADIVKFIGKYKGNINSTDSLNDMLRVYTELLLHSETKLSGFLQVITPIWTRYKFTGRDSLNLQRVLSEAYIQEKYYLLDLLNNIYDESTVFKNFGKYANYFAPKYGEFVSKVLNSKMDLTKNQRTSLIKILTDLENKFREIGRISAFTVCDLPALFYQELTQKKLLD